MPDTPLAPVNAPESTRLDPSPSGDNRRRSIAPRVLRWPGLDSTGVVDAVITTRHGGVSSGSYESLNLGLHVGDDPNLVVHNRRLSARTIGLDLAAMVFAEQVHGCRVAVVGSHDRGRGTLSPRDAVVGCDALVTADADVGLAIMVADCVPIVMVDPIARVIACVHAGWRGTTSGITQAALENMVDLGAAASRVVVGIGPAIPPKNYQVGAEVAEALGQAFGETNGILVADDDDHWRLDLVAANHRALTQAGVDPAKVHVVAKSTGSSDFFSYRRQGQCGRFAVLARIRDHDSPYRTEGQG